MGHTKTPLRYPGGKQRLTPFLIEILEENGLTNAHYVEPYAGGAGAALELLFAKKVNSIHLNDSSRPIYAFWYSVLNYTEELCRLVMSASLTVEEWKRHRTIVNSPKRRNLLELGFSTLYLNRCNRSGILSGGIIGGNDQSGNYKMDARFSRTNLIEKIQNIASKKRQITLSNLDAEVFLCRHSNDFPIDTLVYLDPPYYIKGSDLYLNFYQKSDHVRLSELIQNNQPYKWILSYDAAIEVLNLYQQRAQFVYELQYNASRVYKGREVFIFCDDINIPNASSLECINTVLKKMNSD
jgi:DNA adenine methylase